MIGIKDSMFRLLVSLIFVTVFSCQPPESEEVGKESSVPDIPEQTRTYTNPVIQASCADPTLLDNRAKDGYFYAYTTQASGKTLPIYRSKDLVDWEVVEGGFEKGKEPAWTQSKASLWAPDINFVDGKYVLFYSLGIWNDVIQSASGVAVAASPKGPFKDLGKIVDYSTIGVKNAIDPCFFRDGDNKYLYFGSYGKSSGIWVVELDDDAVSLKAGATPVKLAGDEKEGAYVMKKDGYYYLFASQGSCCEHAASTYHVVVGRSSSPFGPFSSKSGMSMIDTKDYDQIVVTSPSNKSFAGPGHNSKIIQDDAGQYWMLLHSYHKGDDYKDRQLCLEQILWTSDGWPYTKNRTVSLSAKAPIFKGQL